MGSVTVVSLFVEEVPITDIINWATIGFWISMGIAFGFGVYFSIYIKEWWAGLVAGIAIIALVIFTLLNILLYGIFPLIPGADITIISLISLFSIGSVGLVIGKSASDKKHGMCIPFLEDCTKYDCEKVGKCKKV